MRNNDDDPLECIIESRVCDYGRSRGVESYKFTSPNRRSVPDRIFFHNGKTMLIEFKRLGELPTASQQREISRLIKQRIPTFVVDNIEDGKMMIDIFVESVTC